MSIKARVKRELTDKQIATRKKLFYDKRVRHILECEDCGTAITLAESRRNGGICNDCLNPQS
jgi:hypothetical protein